MNNQRGFTLAEILVVMSMIMMLSGFMAQNFSRFRINVDQSRLAVVDAIREAQSLALAGAEYDSQHRCGFGIHFTATGYLVYTGPDSSAIDCADDIQHDRAYNDGSDEIVRSTVFSGGTVEMVLPAADIFFQPPDPVTYICTSSPCGVSQQLPNTSTDITVRKIGAACPPMVSSSDCKRIHVTTAGVITVQ